MGWAEVVTAISTAVIAGVVLAFAVAGLMLMREVRALMGTMERLVDVLDRDARPALQSARTMAEDAGKVVAAVRAEVDGLAETSEDVRGRLNRLVRRAEERLQDLDALVDVVQYEVEETALDVAAALRTTRRGTSIARAMKRAFLGRGR
ncbi:MAG: hypothetical protein GTN78_16625 [Gemmatimonadales bacterium]|nr:hypothetical protein [Gemmatimonadales bacterium]